VPTGTFSPDSGGATFANTFYGLTADGTWTLFFADLSSDTGSHSQLTSWSMGITAVPEPVNVALGIFGGVAVCVIVAHSRPVRDRVKPWRAAATTWIDAV
jgi:hypothetical protein